MTTYPIDLPASPKFKALQFSPTSVVAMSRSPFSGAQQIYVHPGAWWEAQAVLPPMQRADADAWTAALLSLNGQEGTFYLQDPVGGLPRGGANGAPNTPVLDGDHATGLDVISTRGWTPGQGVFLPGDWLTIGAEGRLHKALTTTVADGAGKTSIAVWPPMRLAKPDGTSVGYLHTKGVFRLAANQWPFQWDEGPLMTGLGFKAIEAF